MPERTQMGSPFTGAAPYKAQIHSDSTLSVLSNMAKLTAGTSKVILDAQEDQSIMDAQNDVVNDSVNPDKEMHDAAYAWTVAEGDAWNTWNGVKADLESGKYNETDPEDFQQLMRDIHEDYYKQWSDNPNGSGAVKAYNKVMIRNGATLVAGQAGIWRKDQGVKQEQALTKRIMDMGASLGNTEEDYAAVIESPQYTMLGSYERMRGALVGATNQAELSGDNSLLKGLNDKYDYDAHPQLQKMYAAALKAGDRTRYAKEGENAYNVVNQVDMQVQEGVLFDENYESYKDARDEHGNRLFTPKQWKALVNKSNLNRAKKNAGTVYGVGYTTGIDLTETKQSDFDNVADSQYRKDLLEADGDPLIAMEKTGKYLARQSKDWGKLKKRTGMFSREPMMVDNKPNKESMRQYYELAALERGMNATTDGEGVFTRYMGKALVQYESIKDSLKFTKDTEDGAWTTVAASLEARKKESANRKIIAGFSNTAIKAGEAISLEVYESNSNPFLPDFIEGTYGRGEPSSRLKILASQAYENAKGEGASDSVAYEVSQKITKRQFSKLGGVYFDTWGTSMVELTGTTDPEGALKTMMDDPEHSKHFEDMYGVTFWEMYFGKGETGTAEEDVREYQEERKDKKLYVSKTDLQMDVNMDTGMLEFQSRDAKGNLMSYAVSLQDMGAIHNAKLNKVVDITQLDRLYNIDHLSTEDGREWFNKQSELNDKFATEVLETSVGTQILGGEAGVVSADTYVALNDKDRTRVRKQYHLDKYDGAMGKIRQIKDFFIGKYEADTLFVPLDVTYPFYPEYNTKKGIADISKSYTDDRYIYDRSNMKQVIPLNEQDITADTIAALIPAAEGTDRYKEHGYTSEYDVTFAYGKYDPVGMKPVTSLTLREAVIASNKIRKASGATGGPLGKYQFLGSTIEAVYKQAGLSMSDTMTPANQEKMYRVALDHAGYSGWKAGTRSKASFLSRLKGYWEGFGKNPKEIDILFGR